MSEYFITAYQAAYLAALNVTESDAPICLNTLVGRRCRAIEGGRCTCNVFLHGEFYDHPLMMVRKPRLRVLLLEPYVDLDTYLEDFEDFRAAVGSLDLHAAIGTPGTGRWARVGQAQRIDAELMTVPVAISPHEWLAAEVAEFDLPLSEVEL